MDCQWRNKRFKDANEEVDVYSISAPRLEKWGDTIIQALKELLDMKLNEYLDSNHQQQVLFESLFMLIESHSRPN